MSQCSSLAGFNEQNRAFWAVEAPRAVSRLEDSIVGKFALARIKRQLVMGTPVHCQSTLEYELEQGEKFKEAVRSELRTQVFKQIQSDFGRRGGQAKKESQLQQLINAYVASHHNCSLKALENHLESLKHLGVIEDFTEKYIEFVDHDNKLKKAPRSGLKHCLTRARKLLGKS